MEDRVAVAPCPLLPTGKFDEVAVREALALEVGDRRLDAGGVGDPEVVGHADVVAGGRSGDG